MRYLILHKIFNHKEELKILFMLFIKTIQADYLLQFIKDVIQFGNHSKDLYGVYRIKTFLVLDNKI
jgi:hypothetical protein